MCSNLDCIMLCNTPSLVQLYTLQYYPTCSILDHVILFVLLYILYYIMLHCFFYSMLPYITLHYFFYSALLYRILFCVFHSIQYLASFYHVPRYKSRVSYTFIISFPSSYPVRNVMFYYASHKCTFHDNQCHFLWL